MIKLDKRQAMILNLPCFSNFTKSESLQLAELMEEVRYNAGDIIVTEAQPVDSIYIIEKGTAEVFHDTTINQKIKSQLIAILRTGESIGLSDMGFFSPTGLRTATVKASTAMRLLRLSMSHLHQFLQQHPKLNESMAHASKKMLQIHFIKSVMPFAELSYEQIQNMIEHLEEKTVAPKEIIFHEGDIGDNCYLIYDGKIEIFITDEDGKEHTLARLSKPELFGETSLLSSALRNASARAVEESTLLVMRKKDFLDLVTKNKMAKHKIIEIMLRRGRPIANQTITVHQHQMADGETVIILKNSKNNTYYQLSQEGWFIFQQLNGKNTIHDISVAFKKHFNQDNPDLVYNLIIELIEADFATYPGQIKSQLSHISVITYDTHGFYEINGTQFEECFPIQKKADVTWVNIEGLHNLQLINNIANHYNLHALTIGDILNTDQRAKIEEFSDYIFMTLKVLSWNKEHEKLSIEQVSFVLGKNYILSFQESEQSSYAATIKEFLHTKQGHRIREHGADYLLYRLIDSIVDQYFVVLEDMGERIEKIEELILSTPTPQNAHHLYRFKRQMLMLRKTIWPVREAISHLMQIEGEAIKRSTALYLRDLYDHVAQSIDTIETFRDMLAGMLDIYLSSLTNRMNEIIKVLTIISTIFIPITFVASIYGMNFLDMPELQWHYGYPVILLLMLIVIIGMFIFFKNKKWI